MITESVELVSDMTAARPFSWRCTVCGEQGKSYLRNSANHTQARRHRCAAATVHSEGGSHYARCEHSSHAPWGWTGFSFTSQGAAETQLTEHLAMHPAVELARTSGQVAVVRMQDTGQLPVWTIHLRGEAPIYVALSLADADRVADHWAASEQLDPQEVQHRRDNAARVGALINDALGKPRSAPRGL